MPADDCAGQFVVIEKGEEDAPGCPSGGSLDLRGSVRGHLLSSSADRDHENL